MLLVMYGLPGFSYREIHFFLIQVDRIFRDRDKIRRFKPLKGDPDEDISTEGT